MSLAALLDRFRSRWSVSLDPGTVVFSQLIGPLLYQLIAGGVLVVIPMVVVLVFWGEKVLGKILDPLVVTAAACWPPVAFMMGVHAFWINCARARAIEGIPRARIASASHGHVMLSGQCRKLQGEHFLNAPMGGQDVLWYRYHIADQHSIPHHSGISQTTYVVTHTEESKTPFLLDDGSGKTCVVLPEGSGKFIKRHVEQGISRRYRQWSLCTGDTVYVIGDFRQETIARPPAQAEKHDTAFFWEGDETQVIRKPDDGRLFLISDHAPAKIVRNFKLWAFFYAFDVLGVMMAGYFFYRVLP